MYYKNNQLFHNSKNTGYSVVSDEKYPTMWRIRFPDGEVSDMANYTRTRNKLKDYLSDENGSELEGPTELTGAFKSVGGRDIPGHILTLVLGL